MKYLILVFFYIGNPPFTWPHLWVNFEHSECHFSGGKGGARKADSGMANVQDARREMTKTKEQLEEEKRISLSIRIKPLDVDSMDSDQLMSKAAELWDTIVRLETEKYDLEERQKRQDYDVSIKVLVFYRLMSTNIFCQILIDLLQTVCCFIFYENLSNLSIF